MPRFSYRGRDSRGESVEGVIEAANSTAVAGQLSSTGVTPLHIEAAVEQFDVQAWINRRLGRDKPNRAEMVMFFRQLYALVRAGVPMIRGLRQLADSTRNEMFAETLNKIVSDLESGRDFASCLARHPRVFTPLMLAMIRVGEVSGRLDDALERLFDYLDREAQAINAIKTALRYPIMVVSALFIAVFIIMGSVIPKFAGFYGKNGLDLPLPTKIIIAMSEFVSQHWYLLALLIVASISGFIYYINQPRGRLWWDGFKVTIPRLGTIVRRATLARFARAFGMSLRSGVPILQALAVSGRALDNEYVAGKLAAMREGIERGETLTRTAARSGVFTPLVLQMMSVGEEAGQLEEMLEEVAAFYERDVDYDIKRLSSLIEPLLTVAMAGLVLILALGVFLPMWDMAQLAQR